jgi:glycosyltransferase involved in cell wall biosynthesis
MNPLPRITIVTPSFNQAAFIEETILSVLSQEYPSLEYIVMDGGSTDGSVEFIRKYEGKLAYWQSGKDKGQSDAISNGFARATGEILGWLNSDDTLAQGTLRRVGEFFAAHPDVDITYGNMYLIDPSGRRLYTAYPLLDLRILAYENRFIPACHVLAAGLYERVKWAELHFAMDFSGGQVPSRRGAVCQDHKPRRTSGSPMRSQHDPA